MALESIAGVVITWRMATHTLESTIAEIVSRVSLQMAMEIARAVRQGIAAEIAGGAAAAPIKQATGRSTKEAGTAARSTERKRRKPRKLPRVTEAQVGSLLAIIKKKPGLTSVELQKEAGLDSAQAKRVLLKLRQSGRVKTKGLRSAARYSAA